MEWGSANFAKYIQSDHDGFLWSSSYVMSVIVFIFLNVVAFLLSGLSGEEVVGVLIAKRFEFGIGDVGDDALRSDGVQ